MKKETFCRYIRQYETDMFRFAKSIVGTQADGEDAMQESILKAYENIDTLRSRRKFKAWIFQILANECYQILRNRKRQEPTDPFEFPEQEHSSDYWTRRYGIRGWRNFKLYFKNAKTASGSIDLILL